MYMNDSRYAIKSNEINLKGHNASRDKMPNQNRLNSIRDCDCRFFTNSQIDQNEHQAVEIFNQLCEFGKQYLASKMFSRPGQINGFSQFSYDMDVDWRFWEQKNKQKILKQTLT